MRVLVYAPLAVLGHHFETDLELIQNHLDQGDDVTIVTCEGQLRDLNFMACQGLLRCQFCKSRCDQGVATLKHPAKLKRKSIGMISPISGVCHALELSNTEQVTKFEYKNVDIGSAYMSSVASDFRNTQLDMSKRTEKTRLSLEFLAGLTDRLSKILDETKPEIVYFFNGRFTLYRSLLRLCEQRKIAFLVHERGAANNLYSVTKDNMPHDIATKEKEIAAFWNRPNVSKEEKIKLGSAWYDGRAKGLGFAWYSFTDQQNLALLPKSWSEKQVNISLFVSSEDEFVGVPGWELDLFKTQVEAVSFILSSFVDKPEFRFFIRMHPNLRGLKNSDIDDIKILDEKFRNCEVVSPDSDVSSYLLLKKSNKVLVFGSTTGIEAAYMGTPSILVGKAFYMSLGSLYQPKTREELLALLINRDLKGLPRDGALKYGYWAATVGEPFKHYQALTLTTGRFNGKIIVGKRFYMFASYLSVLLLDIKKILKGEYGFWHLVGKIKAKSRLLRA